MPIDLLFELQIDISAFCVDRIAAHKLRYGAEIFVIRKETAVEQLGKIVYVLTLRNQRVERIDPLCREIQGILRLVFNIRVDIEHLFLIDLHTGKHRAQSRQGKNSYHPVFF